MKKYVKAEILAKNATTGSYAAGCGADHSNGSRHNTTDTQCRRCEVNR